MMLSIILHCETSPKEADEMHFFMKAATEREQKSIVYGDKMESYCSLLSSSWLTRYKYQFGIVENMGEWAALYQII